MPEIAIPKSHEVVVECQKSWRMLNIKRHADRRVSDIGIAEFSNTEEKPRIINGQRRGTGSACSCV